MIDRGGRRGSAFIFMRRERTSDDSAWRMNKGDRDYALVTYSLRRTRVSE